MEGVPFEPVSVTPKPLSTKTIVDTEGKEVKVTVSTVAVNFTNGTVVDVPITVSCNFKVEFPDDNNSSHHQEGSDLEILGGRVLICPVCSKNLADEVTLRRHLWIHQKWSFVCKDDPGNCNANFSNKTSLTKHRMLKHGFKVHRDQSNVGKARKKAAEQQRKQ